MKKSKGSTAESARASAPELSASRSKKLEKAKPAERARKKANADSETAAGRIGDGGMGLPCHLSPLRRDECDDQGGWLADLLGVLVEKQDDGQVILIWENVALVSDITVEILGESIQALDSPTVRAKHIHAWEIILMDEGDRRVLNPKRKIRKSPSAQLDSYTRPTRELIQPDSSVELPNEDTRSPLIRASLVLTRGLRAKLYSFPENNDPFVRSTSLDSTVRVNSAASPSSSTSPSTKRLSSRIDALMEKSKKSSKRLEVTFDEDFSIHSPPSRRRSRWVETVDSTEPMRTSISSREGLANISSRHSINLGKNDAKQPVSMKAKHFFAKSASTIKL
eukprot:CAMPEP_0184680116 /NCGR_PEP_ID=MMETSP0312-20130426/2977_1 /TAXON_ID=31354 /ORGANISM="Compsopogon coeruleus, Strain SAG 36.94" /LENGTH=336 /DNA_ID=CAMNT_0027130003 /DNA_START=2296 /DNA_END=3306 /DNA_ORIENTATION=+